MVAADAEIPVLSFFAGWGDSEIWYGSPIPWETLQLSEGLKARVQTWAYEHYRRVNATMNDGAPERTAELKPEAVVLARQVAAELGAGFVIEVDDPHSEAKLRIASPAPATNPVAAASVGRWVADIDRRRQEFLDVVADAAARGHTLEWTAHDPDSTG